MMMMKYVWYMHVMWFLDWWICVQSCMWCDGSVDRIL